MTHEPECPKSDSSYTRMNHVPLPVCICSALRACESRVRDGIYTGSHDTHQAAYAAGLDAARDAVAASIGPASGGPFDAAVLARALAAIDALRGTP